MPITLKISGPVSENESKMPAAVVQASRAVRSRCSRESFGVIARNAGAVASGSMITNSELAANTMYSVKLIGRN